MAYSTLLGELSYRLTLDADSFNRGMSDTQRKIKVLGTETSATDKTLKSFSQQTRQAGSSLASLGGVAIVSGAAIGGDLGGAVQSVGMGMAALGGTASIAADAIRLVGVAGTGMITALGGPTTILAVSTLAIGLGAVAYAANDAYGSTRDLNREIKENGKLFDDADKALKGYLDHINEIKNIPKEKGELEFEKRGLGLEFLRAGAALTTAQAGGDTLTIAEAQYRKDSIERQLLDVDEQIRALEKKPAALGPTMTREALAARGIPTGTISAMPPGTWELSEGTASTLPLIGDWVDRTFGKSGRAWEFRPANAFDAYGAPANPLYNTTLPEITININGTVTDKTFTVPGSTLEDQARSRGY